jgi:hypothetical protein
MTRNKIWVSRRGQGMRFERSKVLTPQRVALAVLVLDQKDARREVEVKVELGGGRSFSLERALLEERVPLDTGAFLAVLGCGSAQ